MSADFRSVFEKGSFPYAGLVRVPLVAWLLFGLAVSLKWVNTAVWPQLLPVVSLLGGMGFLAPVVAAIMQLLLVPVGLYHLAKWEGSREFQSILALICGFSHICIVLFMLSVLPLFHG